MSRDESIDPQRPILPRVLGPSVAFCAIVGSVIGSGIFIVPGRVAAAVPAMSGIALAWVIGGLFSLAGALTVAELGAMLPHAGGPYVYLRRAYGPLPAFLFGWTEFLVIRAGSIATLAAAFALYFSQLAPAPEGMRAEVWEMIVAVSAMAGVAVVNVLGTRVGGGVQVIGTGLKIGALATMMVLPFLLGEASTTRLTPVWPEAVNTGFFEGFMLAMVGVLWTYDGWINSSSLAEEIREPERNIPRALVWGTLALIAIYLGMTLVYHMVLPLSEMAQTANAEKGTPRVVAAVFLQKLLGGPGLVAISLVVMCSTLISLNGNSLSGPRAYFAMARDGLFPRGLCRIHPTFRTPANAILAQAGWSIALTLAGTAVILTPPPSGGGLPRPLQAVWTKLHETPLYDVMFSYVIFGGTLIYTLTIASVFVLRMREPDLPRPYRTWGYPVTPLLYLGGAGLLLASMLWNTTLESLSGLLVIALGVPAYRMFTRRNAFQGPR